MVELWLLKRIIILLKALPGALRGLPGLQQVRHPGQSFTATISGREHYRYHLDHRYQTDGSRTGLFMFCAIPGVPVQAFAGLRPAETCAGTTGIAQNLKTPVRDPLVRYRWSR